LLDEPSASRHSEVGSTASARTCSAMSDSDGITTTERPVLTLHHGDAQASFAEHPVEGARRLLTVAAEQEQDPEWCSLFLRFAALLPTRTTVAVPNGA
jgi:hypothetical protein